MSDFEKYQEENFKSNPSLRYNLTILNNRPNLQFFRFKDTKDIILVVSVLNVESTKNWDYHVKAAITLANFKGDSYIENLELKDGSGVIQMFDEYTTHFNALYYQNNKVGVTLKIYYISNANNETRLKNMRLILNELKVRWFYKLSLTSIKKPFNFSNESIIL